MLFALPLLIVYEGLAALLGGDDGGTLRNGADVLLRSMFTLVVGRNGSLVFIAVVILVGVWFVAHDLKRSRGSLQPSIFFAMLAESAVLAIAFGIVVGALTARILGSMHLLAIGQIEQANWPTRLMLSLGADFTRSFSSASSSCQLSPRALGSFWGRMVGGLGSWRLLSVRSSFRRSIISGPTGIIFKSSHLPFAPSAESRSARYTLSAASASPPGRTRCTTLSFCSSKHRLFCVYACSLHFPPSGTRQPSVVRIGSGHEDNVAAQID